MTLYIQPPRGFISLKKLETFAMKRLNLLLEVSFRHGDTCRLQQLFCDESSVVGSECLIPGSVNDAVSHFILRLLIGGDPEMSSFFCEAETTLFDYWFSSMSEEELNKFLNGAYRITQRNWKNTTLAHPWNFQEGESSSILCVFSSIRNSAGSLEDVVKSYLIQSTAVSILLPFQSVTRLLRKRLVVVEKGMAKVPVCRLHDVIVEQFYSLMKISAHQARQAHLSAVDDNRMRLLWLRLKHLYRNKFSSTSAHGCMQHMSLSLSDIDGLFFCYPLCMSSLVTSLRTKHRLKHSARIQLTLFLKEVGLPVHHAIAMWQQEYNQEPGTGSRGGHAWQTDGKRYIYNIRHLYGLEGARRNYQAHCCTALQQRLLGSNDEGGCPFAHWDEFHLSAELKDMGMQDADIPKVLSLRKTQNFSAACFSCLQFKVAKNKGRLLFGSSDDNFDLRGRKETRRSAAKETAFEGDHAQSKETLTMSGVQSQMLTSASHHTGEHAVSEVSLSADDSSDNGESKLNILPSRPSKRRQSISLKYVSVCAKKTAQSVHSSLLSVDNLTCSTFLQKTSLVKNGKVNQYSLLDTCQPSWDVTAGCLHEPPKSHHFCDGFCEAHKTFYSEGCLGSHENTVLTHISPQGLKSTTCVERIPSSDNHSNCDSTFLEHNRTCLETSLPDRAYHSRHSTLMASIRKPVDYFHACYSRLVDGMKS